MEGLTEEEVAIVETVRDFVDTEVKPVARELEHDNTYPEKLIEQMKQMGIFGLADPRAVGRRPGDAPRATRWSPRSCRAGWMSLAGAMGGHTVVAKLLLDHGTAGAEGRATCRGWRPASCARRWRSPSPVAARTCRRCERRRRGDGDEYVVNGAKTWITNARRAGLIALLCKTDPPAAPAAQGHQHPAGREGSRLHRLPRPARSSATRAWRAASSPSSRLRVPRVRAARRRTRAPASRR